MISENLSGKRFGKLVVLMFLQRNKIRDVYRCKCDCGNTIDVLDSNLIKGLVKSCGCGSKETQFKKKYNEYDLSGYFGIGYDSFGREFYFDLEDYDLIKDRCWLVKKDNSYIVSQIKGGEIKLHLLIMNRLGQKDGLVVDHINGDKTDNRKSNLRICTPSQNAQNSLHNQNKTSGITGISFSSWHQKYRARITVNRKVIQIGYFENLEDAIIARKESQEKYFGEFNPDRRL